MGIINGYATLQEVKKKMFGPEYTSTDWDALIEQAVEDASRIIDRYCHRRFYSTTADETFYFETKWRDVLFIPEPFDLLSVTTLATDSDGDRVYEYTWAAGDYDLMPVNAQAITKPEPYTWIQIAPTGNYTFPRNDPRGIKIVGKFGYCTAANLPDEVRWCCAHEAMRRFQLKNAPFGVAGSFESAQIISPPGLDKTVAETLLPFVKESLLG